MSRFHAYYDRIWSGDSCTYSRQNLYNFYFNYFLQKIMSVYKWKMEEGWNEDFFKYALYGDGFIAILYTLEYGTVPQRCGFLGYNLFECPTKILVSNQFIFNQIRRIDYDCVVIKLEPNYNSPADIVHIFAQQMTEIHLALLANARNVKMPTIFGVKNSKEKETMEKFYEEVDKGIPAVFLKKNWDPIKDKEPWFTFQSDATKNYIIDQLLGNLREIEAQFDAMIGLPALPFEKKERMNQSEVTVKASGTKTRAEMWLDEMKEGCKKARAMFGLSSFDVDWREHESLSMRRTNIDPERNVQLG